MLGAKRFNTVGRQFGFNLIELMVSMLVGMLVVAGAVGLIVNINSSNARTVESARLTQELRATLQLIAGDLLRARRLDDPFGEIGKGALAQANGNIYYSTFDPITSPTPTGAANCILYSYQGDENNVTGTGDPVDGTDAAGEQYRAVLNDRGIHLNAEPAGFGSVRLVSNVAIFVPPNPPLTAPRSLTVACDDSLGTSTKLSSDQVDITALTFAPASPTTNVSQGAIAITLKGRLRNQAGENLALIRTVTQTVNIRSPKAGN
jgi:Tfp pilus assembly protein PilV